MNEKEQREYYGCTVQEMLERYKNKDKLQEVIALLFAVESVIKTLHPSYTRQLHALRIAIALVDNVRTTKTLPAFSMPVGEYDITYEGIKIKPRNKRPSVERNFCKACGNLCPVNTGVYETHSIANDDARYCENSGKPVTPNE